MKKSMKKVISSCMAVMTVVAFCVGCGNTSTETTTAAKATAAANTEATTVAAGADVQRTEMFIRLACGPSGSTAYTAYSTMANLVNTKYPEYVFAPDVSSGSAENVRAIAAGEKDIGLVMSDVAFSAYNVDREFVGEEKLRECVNYVMAGGVCPIHMMVRADSDITSLSQLEGKKLGVSKGSMSQFYFPAIMEAYGYDVSKLKVETISLNDICTALQDGTIDFGIHMTSAPSGVIADLAHQKGIRLISLEPEMLEKIMTDNPYFVEATIPADSYTDVNYDTVTVGCQDAICCRPDLDEQFVYDFCDVVFASYDDLYAVSPTAAEYSLKNAMQGATIPIHPGAERWYRDNGYLK